MSLDYRVIPQVERLAKQYTQMCEENSDKAKDFYKSFIGQIERRCAFWYACPNPHIEYFQKLVEGR